jgi:hypothetical protein
MPMKRKPNVPAVAVTPQTLTKTESEYQKLLDTTCTTVQVFQKSALEFYYKLGGGVYELTNRSDKYGKQSVNKFSEDLEARHVFLKPNTLYDAQAVFRNFTAEQLKLAKGAAFSVRKALLLCNKNVTEEVKQEVLEEAFKHKDDPKAFDVQKAVEAKLGMSIGDGEEGKEEKGSTSKDGATGGDLDATALKKAVSKIHGASGIVNTLMRKLDGVDDAIALICGEDSVDKINAAFMDMDAAVTSMDELQVYWGNMLKSANTSFKKVKSVISSK